MSLFFSLSLFLILSLSLFLIPRTPLLITIMS